jgi:hypothetical protein
MLSFLRDQSLEDLPAEKKNNAANTAGKAPSQGTDTSQEPEYLTVATHEKRTRKSTILLAVLFTIGLVCLWFMIKKSTPKTASAADETEQTLIETAISRLTGVKSQMFDRMDEIVKKFYEFSEVPQVEVNELSKNPFELETFLANLKRQPGAEGMIDEIDAKLLWQQQVQMRSKGMQLLSIMQSSQGNCCMIDDKILYVGDKINDFTVLEIGTNFVTLESDGVQTVLKLSE